MFPFSLSVFLYLSIILEVPYNLYSNIKLTLTLTKEKTQAKKPRDCLILFSLPVLKTVLYINLIAIFLFSSSTIHWSTQETNFSKTEMCSLDKHFPMRSGAGTILKKKTSFEIGRQNMALHKTKLHSPSPLKYTTHPIITNSQAFRKSVQAKKPYYLFKKHYTPSKCVKILNLYTFPNPSGYINLTNQSTYKSI